MGPVVCSIDNSEGARAALQAASRLGEALELPLVVLHVEPAPTAPGLGAAPGGHERLLQDELRDAEALITRLASEAGVEGFRPRVEIGPAAERIVHACEDEGAALVVVGSHRRAGVKAALLGSVSAQVAAKAPCPCLIVPPGATLPGSSG